MTSGERLTMAPMMKSLIAGRSARLSATPAASAALRAASASASSKVAREGERRALEIGCGHGALMQRRIVPAGDNLAELVAGVAREDVDPRARGGGEIDLPRRPLPVPDDHDAFAGKRVEDGQRLERLHDVGGDFVWFTRHGRA